MEINRLLRLILCAGLTVVVSFAGAAPAPTLTPQGISGIFVDTAQIYHDTNSNGDTWDYAWADDDNLYTFADDSRGYSHSDGRNLNFNRLTGDAWDKLTGSSVNTMDEYGKSSQAFANGANWKTTGCDCIDGVLYAFIANNWYGDKPAYGIGAIDPYLRQTALNLSLIKSTDDGKTWTRSESENYDHPMWTSFKFSTAYFFKYGKNGGSGAQDSQDKYVYAISNDGYWNDGTNFYLGRVPRTKIGSLHASDWQFYANGQWISNVEGATPIPGFPNGQVKCTSGSPLWLAALHKYVTVTWYNPEPADTRLKWDYPQDRIFDFYQADHPWGPWSDVGEIKASDFLADRREPTHRWYGPSFSPKFITANADKSVTAIMTFAGMTWDDTPDSLYKNNCCPVTFYTAPQPRLLQWVNDNNSAIVYSDGWDDQQHRGVGDYYDDLHVSSTPGATIDFTFQGSGIEVLSEKHSDLGAMEVVIDGVSAGTVSQTQNPFPLLYRVPIYRNMGLTQGTHMVRLISKALAGTKVTFDGYRVYSNTLCADQPTSGCACSARGEIRSGNRRLRVGRSLSRPGGIRRRGDPQAGHHRWLRRQVHPCRCRNASDCSLLHGL